MKKCQKIRKIEAKIKLGDILIVDLSEFIPARSLEEEVSKYVRRGLNTNQQEPGQIAMENILLLLKMHTPNLIYEGQSC